MQPNDCLLHKLYLQPRSSYCLPTIFMYVSVFNIFISSMAMRLNKQTIFYSIVTNSEIHRRTGQPLLSDIVRARRLKLFGHVARADKSQDHSRALRACIWHSPKNWKRRLGRPRHTWLRTVEADLRPFNLGLASGFKKAQDRTTWRALTGTATSPTSPE